MGFSERIDSILNCADPSCVEQFAPFHRLIAVFGNVTSLLKVARDAY